MVEWIHAYANDLTDGLFNVKWICTWMVGHKQDKLNVQKFR